jgi:hypothetical protein
MRRFDVGRSITTIEQTMLATCCWQQPKIPAWEVPKRNPHEPQPRAPDWEPKVAAAEIVERLVGPQIRVGHEKYAVVHLFGVPLIALAFKRAYRRMAV